MAEAADDDVFEGARLIHDIANTARMNAAAAATSSRANSEHHFETKTDEPHSFTDVEPLDQGHVQHHGHVQLDQVLDQGHVQLDQSQYDSNHVRHDQGHVQHGHIEEGEVAHNIELRGEDGLTLEKSFPISWASIKELAETGDETIGDIAITQEQLLQLIQNKSGDEIVTLQVHDIEGVRDGVVHIVPQDQFYSMKEDGGLCKDEEPTSPVSVNQDGSVTVGAEIDFSNRNAPVLRLSQDDIQSLVKAPVPIKSMVVKTLPKARQARNCLAGDKVLSRYVNRMAYVDIDKHDIMADVPRKVKLSKTEYVCQICTKSFSHNSNLKRHHHNLHRQKLSASCPTCGKVFSRADYVAQHIKTVHETANASLSDTQCNLCHKKFSQKCTRDRHIRAVHWKVKPFVCKFCGMKTAYINDLIKHAANKHLDRSRYECAVCGFKEWNASVLKNHIKAQHGGVDTLGTPNYRACANCRQLFNGTDGSYHAHIKVCKRKKKKVPSAKQKKSHVSLPDHFSEPEEEHVEQYPEDCVPWDQILQLGEYPEYSANQPVPEYNEHQHEAPEYSGQAAVEFSEEKVAS